MRRLSWSPGIALGDVAASLHRGGLVAFPTETVYGLAGCYGNDVVRERIYAAKRRCGELPLPVQISGLSDLDAGWPGLPAVVHELGGAFWPGPLTVIVAWREEGVGLRVPDHPVAQAVLSAVSVPLWVTSANLSGQPPLDSADQIAEVFGSWLDWIVEGEPRPAGLASTVVDLRGWPGTWRIVREGAVSRAALAAVLDPPGRATGGAP